MKQSSLILDSSFLLENNWYLFCFGMTSEFHFQSSKNVFAEDLSMKVIEDLYRSPTQMSFVWIFCPQRTQEDENKINLLSQKQTLFSLFCCC